MASGPSDSSPGMVAVTASQDNTQVTLVTQANTEAAGGAPAFMRGVPQTVTLNAGDVLEVAATGAGGSIGGDDLTGTVVSADKPIQVLSGHYCTFIPDDMTGYCDHLEESMFPTETLSREYVVTSPAVPPLPNGKEQVIRIIATTGDTQLTFDPPMPGVESSLSGAGQYVQIARHVGNFKVTATRKILVVQYMEGQDAGGDTGDPAMALAVPSDQYRTEYLFHAPTNYEVNYVNVTAPLGASVTLDGNPVTGYTPIGSSGLGVAKVQLGPGQGGNHGISGDVPFGISVYGYGQYTSYWYPGGLDLAPIPEP
jgi:hypothetical protein